MNGLIWFSAWRLLSTSPTLCFKEIQVSTKIRVYFPLELFRKLWTWKMIRHGISIVKRAINLAREIILYYVCFYLQVNKDE